MQDPLSVQLARLPGEGPTDVEDAPHFRVNQNIMMMMMVAKFEPELSQQFEYIVS